MISHRLAALSLVTASLLASSALAQEAGTVVVYTSQPNEQMTAVVEAFNADHPEIEVEVFRTGTTELMTKLQAEFTAGGVEADVMLIADSVAMTQLKNEDRLYAYTDAPVENLPEAVIDPDMTFFGTKLITTGIVYNTDLVSEPPASCPAPHLRRRAAPSPSTPRSRPSRWPQSSRRSIAITRASPSRSSAPAPPS